MDDDKKEKKQFEYLFLDIEWNQAPGTNGLDGREAIQIGVLAADEAMQKVKIFSKGIRLSDPNLFNVETEKICHNPIANTMQGKTEDVVLKKFALSFPQYHYIVVWTKETYDLFKRDMKKYKILMKRHKVVILQDILSVIADDSNKQIGFEKALRCAEIEYRPDFLHYSKHDANYLYQLFYQCYQQYSNVTADEYCIANIVTRKLHTEECRYVSNKPLERLQVVPKSLIFKGFEACKCCGGKQAWKRLELKYKNKARNKKYRDDLKQLPLTEANIERICKWFQLSYSISKSTVFIRTPFAGWIVYLQDDKVKQLFHENYRPRKSQYFKKQKMKFAEEYHKQKLPSENFFEVMQYIKSHDVATVKRMAKKSRVENLLEMVEIELKSKNMGRKD